MLACANSGAEVDDHFNEVIKMVEIGSGAQRQSIDYELSRYACYLIVQNGDPGKEIIALDQSYFAVQTRRQEAQDQFEALDEDARDIHDCKGLKPHQSIADHMSSEELAANLFTATQTEGKLRREKIRSKDAD